MSVFRTAALRWLCEQLQMEEMVLEGMLETPPSRDLGDLAFPCFRLAKELRQAPAQIANRLVLAAKETGLPEELADCWAAGPYVNFRFKAGRYCASVIQQTLEAGPCSSLAEGKREQAPVLVEYSSPNIAKPFHIGHGFATILGESIARLYAYNGYKVERLNHLGDYGTQFGKLIVAWERWRDEKALQKDPIAELTRIYVRFHQEAEKDPSLEDEARRCFRDLEQGDEAAVQLWTYFRELSLQVFLQLYERLGIHFDNLNGESFYSPFIPELVEELKSKQLLEESDGAWVVKLDEENLPPALLLKSDGSTIYASRDIAAVLWREKHYHFAKNIYVVGLPQQLHFQQVFAVLKKAGYEAAERCAYVGFGTVKFKDSAFSTRTGNIVKLETLLDESVSKTRAIIEKNQAERQGDMTAEEIAEIAEKVGCAAVQFLYLKSGRERDIPFSWDEMLDFEGDTAPYLLYTKARISSLLRKAEGEGAANSIEADLEALGDDYEMELCQHLERFDEVCQAACRQHEPSMLSRWLLQLARAYNRFYGNTTVLGTEDKALRAARLCLCEAVASRLEKGLQLLGIRTVERM